MILGKPIIGTIHNPWQTHFLKYETIWRARSFSGMAFSLAGPSTSYTFLFLDALGARFIWLQMPVGRWKGDDLGLTISAREKLHTGKHSMQGICLQTDFREWQRLRLPCSERRAKDTSTVREHLSCMPPAPHLELSSETKQM